MLAGIIYNTALNAVQAQRTTQQGDYLTNCIEIILLLRPRFYILLLDSIYE